MCGLFLSPKEKLKVPDRDMQLSHILLKFLNPAEDKHHPSSPKAQLWETRPPLLPLTLHFEFNQPIGMGHHMSQASNLISHFPALRPCCRSGLDSSGWGSFRAASHPLKTQLALSSTPKTPPHCLLFLCFWVCSRRIQLNYVQRGILWSLLPSVILWVYVLVWCVGGGDRVWLLPVFVSSAFINLGFCGSESCKVTTELQNCNVLLRQTHCHVCIFAKD